MLPEFTRIPCHLMLTMVFSAISRLPLNCANMRKTVYFYKLPFPIEFDSTRIFEGSL